jgi:hypothetical protein
MYVIEIRLIKDPADDVPTGVARQVNLDTSDSLLMLISKGVNRKSLETAPTQLGAQFGAAGTELKADSCFH